MFCSRCGSEVPQGAAFCASCGNRLGAPAAPPPFHAGAAAYSANNMPPLDSLTRPAVVSVLAILNYLGGALNVIAAAGILFFATREAGDRTFPIVFSSASLIFGIGGIVCGYGLWTLKPTGRRLQILFACIGLLLVPLGTIISALILFYFFKPEIKILFSGRSLKQLSQQEMNLLAHTASSYGGATIAVVIVVVFFGIIMFTGIIAAIAVPNLLNAVQRGKQKRTMADMRAIGTACEAYAVDHNAYPAVTTIPDLAKDLEPKYLRQLPRIDGWQQQFYYKPLTPGEDGPQGYVIASAGKDGVLEHEDLGEYVQTVTESFNNDIVFSNGSFLQYPEGAQR